MSLTTPPMFPGLEPTAETTDDYYTPRWVFDLLGLEFDLDVCAPPGGGPWVPAGRWFTLGDDGLSQPWEGRVWMNPPFSKPSPWVERFIAHRDGVALLPFTRAKWSLAIWQTADGIVFPDQYVDFRRGDTVTHATFQPVFLVAFGQHNVAALANMGRVLL